MVLVWLPGATRGSAATSARSVARPSSVAPVCDYTSAVTLPPRTSPAPSATRHSSLKGNIIFYIYIKLITACAVGRLRLSQEKHLQKLQEKGLGLVIQLIANPHKLLTVFLEGRRPVSRKYFIYLFFTCVTWYTYTCRVIS